MDGNDKNQAKAILAFAIIVGVIGMLLFLSLQYILSNGKRTDRRQKQKEHINQEINSGDIVDISEYGIDPDTGLPDIEAGWDSPNRLPFTEKAYKDAKENILSDLIDGEFMVGQERVDNLVKSYDIKTKELDDDQVNFFADVSALAYAEGMYEKDSAHALDIVKSLKYEETLITGVFGLLDTIRKEAIISHKSLMPDIETYEIKEVKEIDDIPDNLKRDMEIYGHNYTLKSQADVKVNDDDLVIYFVTNNDNDLRIFKIDSLNENTRYKTIEEWDQIYKKIKESPKTIKDPGEYKMQN